MSSRIVAYEDWQGRLLDSPFVYGEATPENVEALKANRSLHAAYHWGVENERGWYPIPWHPREEGEE
jgi:hypothetical protein